MKRLRSNNGPGPRTHRRRGAVFHYYMMYLFLSSILLTTAGLSLHLVLKADHLDDQIAHQLRTQLRLDRELRADIVDNRSLFCRANELTIRYADGSTVTWTVRDNRISRSRENAESQTSSDQFVFRKGTTMTFVQEDDNSLVKLTIVEAAIAVSGETAVSSPTTQHTVEILLATDSPERPGPVPQNAGAAAGNMDPELSEDPSASSETEGGAS